MSLNKHMRVLKDKISSGVGKDNKAWARGTAAYDYTEKNRETGKYENKTQWVNFIAYGDVAEYLLNSDKKFFKITADNIYAGEPFKTKDGKLAVNLNMTFLAVQRAEFNFSDNQGQNQNQAKNTVTQIKPAKEAQPQVEHDPFADNGFGDSDPFAGGNADPFAPGANGF